MNGQMNIFDFMNTEKPLSDYGDKNIDILVSFIKNEMSIPLLSFPKLNSTDISYKVWSHVPNLGKRLAIFYQFDIEYNTEPEKYCGVGFENIAKLIPIEKISKKANELGLIISIIPGPINIFISTIEKSKKNKCKEYKEDE